MSEVIILHKSTQPQDYGDIINIMENRTHNIIQGSESQLIWFLEHNSVFTCGRSGNSKTEVLNHTIPVIESDRGGKVTYHGPGQRIAYLMINLDNDFFKKDIRLYVATLGRWLELSLRQIGIEATFEPGLEHIGVWVKNDETQINEKIASIGVKVRKWTTYHGICINVCNNMGYFDDIIPCGLKNVKMTSIKQLFNDKYNDTQLLAIMDQALIDTFPEVFPGVTLMNDQQTCLGMVGP